MANDQAGLLTAPPLMAYNMPLMLVKDACDRLFERSEVHLGIRDTPLSEAKNRVCASDVVSRIDWPLCPTALRDGIAVSHDRALGCRDEKGRVLLTPGCYEAVSLGEMVREPFDAVVPLDSCIFCLDNTVELDDVPRSGLNVMGPGQRVRRDQVVLKKGMRLNPERLVALRFCGVEKVPLLRKPRVAVIPVGERIRYPQEELAAGESYESVSLYAAELFAEASAEPQVLPAHGAAEAELVEAFKDVAAEYDLVLVIGGCGVYGEEYGDVTARALFETGEIVTRGVDLGPGGERMVFAEVRGTPFVAVSGSPRVAVLQLSTLVSPLMRRLLGVPGGDMPVVRVRLRDEAGPITCSNGPYTWDARSVRVERRGYDDFVATTFPLHDMLSSMSTANGMAYVPRRAEADGKVPVRLRCTPSEIPYEQKE